MADDIAMTEAVAASWHRVRIADGGVVQDALTIMIPLAVATVLAIALRLFGVLRYKVDYLMFGIVFSTIMTTHTIAWIGQRRAFERTTLVEGGLTLERRNGKVETLRADQVVYVWARERRFWSVWSSRPHPTPTVALELRNGKTFFLRGPLNAPIEVVAASIARHVGIGPPGTDPR